MADIDRLFPAELTGLFCVGQEVEDVVGRLDPTDVEGAVEQGGDLVTGSGADGSHLLDGLAAGADDPILEVQQVGEPSDGQPEQMKEGAGWERNREFLAEVAVAPLGEAVDAVFRERSHVLFECGHALGGEQRVDHAPVSDVFGRVDLEGDQPGI